MRSLGLVLAVVAFFGALAVLVFEAPPAEGETTTPDASHSSPGPPAAPGIDARAGALGRRTPVEQGPPRLARSAFFADADAYELLVTAETADGIPVSGAWLEQRPDSAASWQRLGRMPSRGTLLAPLESGHGQLRARAPGLLATPVSVGPRRYGHVRLVLETVQLDAVDFAHVAGTVVLEDLPAAELRVVLERRRGVAGAEFDRDPWSAFDSEGSSGSSDGWERGRLRPVGEAGHYFAALRAREEAPRYEWRPVLLWRSSWPRTYGALDEGGGVVLARGAPFTIEPGTTVELPPLRMEGGAWLHARLDGSARSARAGPTTSVRIRRAASADADGLDSLFAGRLHEQRWGEDPDLRLPLAADWIGESVILEVEFREQRLRAGPRTIAAGENDFGELALQPRGEIRVVFDRVDGRAPSRFEVTADTGSWDSGRGFLVFPVDSAPTATRPEPDGSFVLKNLPPGPFEVEVLDAWDVRLSESSQFVDLAPGESRELHFPIDPTLRSVELTLRGTPPTIGRSELKIWMTRDDEDFDFLDGLPRSLSWTTTARVGQGIDVELNSAALADARQRDLVVGRLAFEVSEDWEQAHVLEVLPTSAELPPCPIEGVGSLWIWKSDAEGEWVEGYQLDVHARDDGKPWLLRGLAPGRYRVDWDTEEALEPIWLEVR